MALSDGPEGVGFIQDSHYQEGQLVIRLSDRSAQKVLAALRKYENDIQKAVKALPGAKHTELESESSPQKVSEADIGHLVHKAPGVCDKETQNPGLA